MPPKWTWTPVPPSLVCPFWQVEPSAVKEITSFSVKFKQLASFESLHLTPPEGPAPPTDLPFPLASVVVVDASINRMRSLNGVHVFTNVRELRLSLNQLSTLPPLDHLEHLRVLHVGNNCLTSLTWLWQPNVLVHLDVSGNDVAALDGISVCSGTLQILNVGENKLASLDGIHRLVNLRELWAQANHLQDASVVHLAALSHLRVLSLGHNDLSHLDTVANAVMGLPSLEDASFLHNPVAECEAYRMRLCQHPGLRTLDSKTITAAMRQSFDRMRRAQDMDSLVEQTTLGYLAHIDAQKHILDEGIRVHRAREQRMTDAFTHYKHNMERELEDCVQFTHVVTTQNRSGYLLSNAGLADWKRQVQMLQVPSSPPPATAAVHHEPHGWRSVKAVELNQRQAEAKAVDATASKSPRSARRRKELERDSRVEAALALASELKVDAVPGMQGTIHRLREKHNGAVAEKEAAVTIVQKAWRRHRGAATNKSIPSVAEIAEAAARASAPQKKFRLSLWRRAKR